MTTDDTRCPSCGILYVSHPGLIPTCRELMEARAEVERLKGNQEHRQRTYELLTRAEIAEAEVLRLREELADVRKALEAKP